MVNSNESIKLLSANDIEPAALKVSLEQQDFLILSLRYEPLRLITIIILNEAILMTIR